MVGVPGLATRASRTNLLWAWQLPWPLHVLGHSAAKEKKSEREEWIFALVCVCVSNNQWQDARGGIGVGVALYVLRSQALPVKPLLQEHLPVPESHDPWPEHSIS